MCEPRAAPFVMLLAISFARAQADPNAEELLRAADMSRHTLPEGVMQVRATVSDKGGPPVESSLDVYVQGEDRVLCIFREGQQKGRRILMVGDRVWLLVPRTTHPIPISANQRLLGGASVADVARLRLADDFSGMLRKEVEAVGPVVCRVVDLERRSPKAPYASGTLWVGLEDGLPHRIHLSLPSGKPAKEIHFAAYTREDGQTVLRRMEIHHLLPSERGMVTALEFIRYDRRTLSSDLFDPVRARDVP